MQHKGGRGYQLWAGAQLRHDGDQDPSETCSSLPWLSALVPRAAGSPVTGGRGRTQQHGDHTNTHPFNFSGQETSSFFSSKTSTSCPNKLSVPPIQGAVSVWESSSPETAWLPSAAADLVQLRAPRLAEVTDAQRQDSPCWPVPSLPHTRHRWPCHLVLAQCPDGPRMPRWPHRGRPGGDKVSDRGE